MFKGKDIVVYDVPEQLISFNLLVKKMNYTPCEKINHFAYIRIIIINHSQYITLLMIIMCILLNVT